jgi:hypothetical protein
MRLDKHNLTILAAIGVVGAISFVITIHLSTKLET